MEAEGIMLCKMSMKFAEKKIKEERKSDLNIY
jgi:hypothetical protein